MKQNTLLLSLSYLLALLFIYAATAKTMDYHVFVADIAKSPLLVNFRNTLLAPAVLGAEFLAAVLLLYRPWVKAGFYLAAFLMLVFTLYLATLYFFYTNIPCSCGGILGKIPYPVHIIFNLVFTLLAIAGVLLSPGHRPFRGSMEAV